MSADKENKTVLISGGGRGLGLAMLKHLLKEGFNVASFSRKKTEAIMALEKDFGARLLFEEIDLTDVEACAVFVKKVVSHFGSLDVLINNAGVAISGVMPLFSDQDIDTVIDLNIKGTVRLTRMASRQMLSSKFGRIINISSIVGSTGYRGLSVYSASKAALDGYTRSLARELGAKGITVNSIAPGFMETEMSHELNARQVRQIEKRTPIGRLGKTDDLLGVLDLLVSDKSKFITGQVITIDGGLTA